MSHSTSAAAGTIPVFDRIEDFRAWRREQQKQNKTVGFVPTMGALHDGHLSLVKVAKQECDAVVVSIFVNPAQFAPHEDLDQYPRTFDTDYQSLVSTQSCAAILLPKVSEMYPSGITLDRSQQRGTFVEVQGLSHQMEGIPRPHFFRGVATVVTKLFNIGHELAQPMRKVATLLYKALGAARQSVVQSGSKDRKQILDPAYAVIEEAIQQVKAQNLGFDIRLDYLSLVDVATLTELEQLQESQPAILSGAVYVGTTRLIDNMLLNTEEL
ncbi:pantothenate synthase [Actinomortierella ambigua]|nr:pantothenate synthase [Actinomortierella ambigua]